MEAEAATVQGPSPAREPAASVAAEGACVLTAHETRIAKALAAAAIPPGRFLEGGGAATVERLERFLHGACAGHRRSVKGLL